MPPPMYTRISVSWFKSLLEHKRLEHKRRCLSGRYRTQPVHPISPCGTVKLLHRDAGTDFRSTPFAIDDIASVRSVSTLLDNKEGLDRREAERRHQHPM